MQDILNQSLQNSSLESLASLQYLTFMVNGEVFGVDILNVIEIKGYTETTHIPNTPEFMLGIINLRGMVIPIFDLKLKFTDKKTEIDEKKVIIIFRLANQNIGILVDAVSDIIEIKEQDIKKSDTVDSLINGNFIKGVVSLEKKMVIILDVEKLFSQKILDNLGKTINNNA